eukprot:CAMPEP_0174374840 /NCGR_PEP_ID=MMETSP0811_2-20130205/112396_1 /TAXON_ID=73025 ORGANISM="Eutreptiella gymnastica-like, Strain CCMP1594" /NCGR_SAMPLE_ID=MMETSP0811_2 /ASSEMBLY_ACC=CAM_ASM_000667 /LENGTH=72 /DNA_ID=CAMNT_0015524507 /DNA_START=85 /DNA_END=300 /DNA_ORIENTATION=+
MVTSISEEDTADTGEDNTTGQIGMLGAKAANRMESLRPAASTAMGHCGLTYFIIHAPRGTRVGTRVPATGSL